MDSWPVSRARVQLAGTLARSHPPCRLPRRRQPEPIAHLLSCHPHAGAPGTAAQRGHRMAAQGGASKGRPGREERACWSQGCNGHHGADRS